MDQLRACAERDLELVLESLTVAEVEVEAEAEAEAEAESKCLSECERFKMQTNATMASASCPSKQAADWFAT